MVVTNLKNAGVRRFHDFVHCPRQGISGAVPPTVADLRNYTGGIPPPSFVTSNSGSMLIGWKVSSNPPILLKEYMRVVFSTVSYSAVQNADNESGPGVLDSLEDSLKFTPVWGPTLPLHPGVGGDPSVIVQEGVFGGECPRRTQAGSRMAQVGSRLGIREQSPGSPASCQDLAGKTQNRNH